MARTTHSCNEDAGDLSPKMLTVDQAAALLGAGRQTVIDLIADGKLSWAMASDKTTVVVEMPSDLERFLSEIGAFAACPETAPQPPLPKPTASRLGPKSRHAQSPTISDLDAWSQPK